MRRLLAPITLLAMALLAGTATAAQADSVSGAQKRAAGEYLQAVSAAGAVGLAQILPQSELDALRSDLLRRMRAEEQQGSATLRKRLFGPAANLASLERQTNQSFFSNLARRLELSARLVYDPEWVAAIRDGNDRAIVVVRGRIADDNDSPRVTQHIELLSDGKDWKPAIPGELRAQLDELMRGRQTARAGAANAAGVAPAGSAAATGAGTDANNGSGAAAPDGSPTVGNPAAIVAMLRTAEQVLVAGKCDRYYKDYMSPNFRRTQSDKAMDTLIASCQRSMGMRELLISALRIVAQSNPTFEAGGNRAVYDVADQGLPYERFTLEMIDKRWYIAE